MSPAPRRALTARDGAAHTDEMGHASRLLAVCALLACVTAGCQCSTARVVITVDGGASARDGGADGGRGGGMVDGGGAGDGGARDAGSGTTVVTVGPGGFSADGGPGGAGDGVKLDPSGFIVLSQGSTQFHFMWIANDTRGWVSKYDTRSGKEVGRYWSVIPRDCRNSPLGPPCAGGQVHGLQAGPGPADSYHPSRTAIDRYGDMWVANRGLGRQGSVTKIANDLSSCVDRNGNGTIDTSRDLNGDGQISTSPSDGEMIVPSDWANPNQYDECVLFTTPVGAVPTGGGVSARALAVAAGLEGSAGDVWVGVFHERRMYKLDGLTGELRPVNGAGAPHVELGFGPYGAIVDRQQRLWVVEPGTGRLALIIAATGQLVRDDLQSPTCKSYGIGIDGKDRVWLPGWTGGARACRYDHATQAWTAFDFTSALSDRGTPFTLGRGIAVDADGQVYMSGYSGTAAQLIRFDAETGAVIPFGAAQFIDVNDTQTRQSVGVALDADGHPWVNNFTGNAMKIDKVTGAVTRTAQQPPGLYTYSDFTGYQLRNFTAPRGTHRRDFEGCDMTDWASLSWDATTPPNSSLQVFVKAAATLQELAAPSLPRYGPFTASPVDLQVVGVPKTKYLLVEFVLTSADGQATPVLKGYDLRWACGVSIN